MPLFTPAYHRRLSCDAFVIDARRDALPLVLETSAPAAAVVDAVLARVLLVSRGLHDARRMTFGLFCGGDLVIALARPCEPSLVSSLEEALAEFGTVRRGPDSPARGFAPLLAYVAGRASFLRGPETRAFERGAARLGLPIVAPVWSDDAEADLLVDGLPFVQEVDLP